MSLSSPRRRGSSTPRPADSNTAISGILDRPPSRTMTTGCAATFSRHELPEACRIISCPHQSEGAGKTGCLLHPRSRVPLRIARDAHEHTGTAGASRPSLRNGFTAYFVLFPENGSFASVAGETDPADLTPAPRRPNHTTSPYTSGAYVYRAISVHRISPRVRDVRERPSSAVRRAELCG
jgi:hypothetical protein